MAKHAHIYVGQKQHRNFVSLRYFTLSPISETNINENAAVKPDLALAAKSDEGPFMKAMSENTKAHPHSMRAIERRYGIRLGDFTLPFNKDITYKSWTKM